MKIASIDPKSPVFVALALLGWLSPSLAAPRDEDIRIKPLRSAAEKAAGNVRVAKGFKLDLIYSVPKKTQGSWVALCVDPKGRLIAADQNGKLYRMTPPPPGRDGSVEPEAIGVNLAGAHGLLYAFDSLYVMVNERGTHGLYRVRDTDGDDRYDEVKLLREIKGGGEHGMHSIVLSPDGKSLYVVCGNSTELTKVDRSRVPLNWGEDNLATRIPTGFMDDSLAPQGWIARTDPDGKAWELIAAGLRNPFDIAFNRDGELFTYDADMEWDIGEPWYRPTRVNHVISGAEFGFRNGSGKWPAYYIDSFGAVVDIGPGSPTGITFGYGAKFPEEVPGRPVHQRLELRQAPRRPPQARGGQLHRRGRGVPQRPAAAGDRRGHQPEGRRDVPRRRRPRGTVGPVPRDLRRRRGRLRRARPDPQARRRAGPAPEAGGLPRAPRRRRGRSGLALPGRPGPGDPLRGPDRAGVAGPVAVAAEGPERARPAQGHRGPGGAGARQRPGRAPSQAGRPDARPGPARPRSWPPWIAIDWSRLGRSDRVDLLRAYALAFIRLGRPDDEACRRLDREVRPPVPRAGRRGRLPARRDPRLSPGADGRREDHGGPAGGLDAGGADPVRARSSAA